MVSLLPLRFLYLLSDIAAFVFRYILRYRNSVVYVNLSRSFPELKYNEIKSVAGEYYRYMCDIMLESIWAISASPKKMCKIVSVENREVIADITQRYNIVLTVMGHSGNWELIGAMFGNPDTRPNDNFSNGKYALAYKQPHGGSADSIMKMMRMHQFKKFKKDGGVVESQRIMRHIIANRKETILYTLIADQNPVGKDKMIVRFLNQPTAMLGGPEYIAKKLNLPVVFLHIFRVKRGRYSIKFTVLAENSLKLQEGEITKRYAHLLENSVNENRYNWLWSHKRWKRVLNRQEAEIYDKILLSQLQRKEELS